MSAVFAHPVQTSIPCLPDTTPMVYLGIAGAGLKRAVGDFCHALRDRYQRHRRRSAYWATVSRLKPMCIGIDTDKSP